MVADGTYCLATEDELVLGQWPAGSPVALRSVAPSEPLVDREMVIYHVPPCPPGYYCGTWVLVGFVRFPADPLPELDVAIDVWGRAVDGGMTADGWRLAG